MTPAGGRWLGPHDLRVGLGCMRLPANDTEQTLATVAAAFDSGVTIFDTARAYAGNESLLATALRRCGSVETARVVTKGGMSRAGGGWVPDGRARAITGDCEASLAALDGIPIDLYLLHAPDPRTPWSTSVRALARLLEQGLVRRVGLSNVTRRQLDEARDIADITAVEIALSPFDDRSLRDGMVAHCTDMGLTVIAHAPLGGPARARKLHQHQALEQVAREHGATAAEVALAWLLDLSPAIVVIPGATRPETARSAARAAVLQVREAERTLLAAVLPRMRPSRTEAVSEATQRGGEAVLIMGIPGAGKSHAADAFVARGYHRLNRDLRGGSLRDLTAAFDAELRAGTRRIVLDNTWLTRASRGDVILTARARGVAVHCVWLDTPLAQAQVNMIERLLDRFGELPSPERIRAASRAEPGLLMPVSQMRALRELEAPSQDEGFVAIERRAFVRLRAEPGLRAGVFIAAAAMQRDGWQPALGSDVDVAALVFDWKPGGTEDELAGHARRLREAVTGVVETALCPHAGGPPACWCRPPLPGLMLAFARRRGLDPTRSLVVGCTATHRTLATALGARFAPVELA